MKKLSKTKLARFEKLFNEQREELRKLINNSDMEVDIDGDDVDVVQANQIHDLASKSLGQRVRRLDSINAAIERIKAGNFGLCEECEEPIGEKRLTAMPHCTLCIECQEEMEQNEKQFRQQ